jgi:hypothetical protein
VDLVARLIRFPWGALAFSTAVSIATGIAILALGMPPKMLVPIAWGTAAIYAALNSWVYRRLGRR